ncbi:carbon monoxide dehydrogenase [Rhizobium sp. CRIBSB]|nr:carbon monoxide dehydrogenase [Rhizobium sp. CRIBSB]
MDMNGSQRIEASREAVYAGLNDVDILRQCIPGCDSIEKTSETEMVAKVTLRIGPVKASFAGTVTLSDLDPPNGYTISGEGSGGMAGFAKGGANVTLEPDGDATILHYVVKAEIGGKLAQMGSRLIDSTAKKLAGDFFAKFGEVVGKPSDVETPPEEQAASKGWMSRILGSSATAFLVIVLAPGLL